MFADSHGMVNLHYHYYYLRYDQVTKPKQKKDTSSSWSADYDEVCWYPVRYVLSVRLQARWWLEWRFSKTKKGTTNKQNISRSTNQTKFLVQPNKTNTTKYYTWWTQTIAFHPIVIIEIDFQTKKSQVQSTYYSTLPCLALPGDLTDVTTQEKSMCGGGTKLLRNL